MINMDEMRHNMARKLETGEVKSTEIGRSVNKSVSEQLARANAAHNTGSNTSAKFARRGRSMRNLPLTNLKIVGERASAKALPERNPDNAFIPDTLALTNAIQVWAHSSVNSDSRRAKDVRRDKIRAVREFMRFLYFFDKDISEATSVDVSKWLEWLESRNLSSAYIYANCSHLSSFFKWFGTHETLGKFFRDNPVKAAFPKSPKPYTSNKTMSLADDDLQKLNRVLVRASRKRSPIGKRDYAMFVILAATGDRRSEIVYLRGKDIRLDGTGLIYYARKKGGERIGKRLIEPEIVSAVKAYLRASGRKTDEVIGKDVPVWLAHDNNADARLIENESGEEKENRLRLEAMVTEGILPKSALARAKKKLQKGMTDHGFAARMQIYAAEAGIENFHLHMIRHSFARIVSEATESVHAAQEALNHASAKTTQIYVKNLSIQVASYSSLMMNRIA